MVRAKLVKIGNSRGIRLAKPLLAIAGLADEVETEASPGVLSIRLSLYPRAGGQKWQQHSIQMVFSMKWAAPALMRKSGRGDRRSCLKSGYLFCFP